MRVDRSASRWASPWIDVGIWAFALGTTAITLWYSLGPRSPGHGSDSQLHFFACFVNTLAIVFAVVWRPPAGFGVRTLLVVVIMLVLGGLIEIAQGGFVNRDSQFNDWIADSVGVMLALMLFVALRRAYRRSARFVD